MIVLTIVLVFLNAFFVLSEFSIVKVRRSRLEELAKSKNSAKLALKVTQNLDSYLSATQLGITLSSLGLGWIGEPAIARILSSFFEPFFSEATLLLHSISFIIAFIFITLLHVVLGEIVPKSIALVKAEECALKIVRPLHLFWLVFYPIIKLFDTFARWFLKLLKIELKGNENIHTDEELKIIAGESLKGGFIDSIESEIIKNAVDFSDTTAKEIMTPRRDMVCLDADLSYEENIKVVLETRFTRYPYFQGSKDNILGMIHIRDFLKYALVKDAKTPDLKNLLLGMIIVPEEASVAMILKEMNKEQRHIALVVDEYGGTAGLLTMEDIIEEVIGDIADEHDERTNPKQMQDGALIIDGKMDLETLEEKYGLHFGETNQVTIGGYVFNLIGKLPKLGDKILDLNAEFEIIQMDGKRIKKIRLTPKENLQKYD
ncbi:MAG: hemolysin family protein [Helicobacter sp.]|nr:hemolysin family protein [Helicobacter sp.]